MEFTTLDDSLVYENGLYVYSHAIITSESSNYILFSGSKNEIYAHEKDILAFVQDNVLGELYACGHYRQYPSVWDVVNFHSSQPRLAKGIVKRVREAHNLAKSQAKQEFEKLK